MLKRLFDITASVLGIVLLIPVFVIVGILIKLDSSGPVFFRQVRVGRGFKDFRIFKFRTMVPDAERRGALVSSGGDPRITRVGGFLRKYKIDELPQLLNVLVGDMSLVGPRPEVRRYVEMFQKDYQEVLSVKPGITDFASLEFKEENEMLRGCADPEKVYVETILPKKIEFYRRYLREQGFLTDLSLILRTLGTLFINRRVQFALAVFFFSVNSFAAEFSCGGAVEQSIWKLWNGTGKKFAEELIDTRLLKTGDTYALYDFQTYFHNLVAMAMRCDRRDRMIEIAEIAGKAYKGLAPAKDGAGRLWICAGGTYCNSTNGHIDTEVMLVSAQFLGLSTQIANWISQRPPPLSKAESQFVNETVKAAVEQSQRWGGEFEDSINTRIRSLPEDVKNGSSELFFSDRDLWMLAILSDLSGALASQYGKANLASFMPEVQKMKKYAEILLKLFAARTTLQGQAEQETAQIDRGFWRLHADARYAAYTDAAKPVVCENGKVRVLKPKDSVPLALEVGWDFSHSRRLVHVLDSIEQNRKTFQEIYGIEISKFLPNHLTKAFANQIVKHVWNGNADQPLFSNYWSGANGWYRVAYDNGTGHCREGIPPFGLSNSFPTGGYIDWQNSVSTLGKLGRRLYALMGSSDPGDKKFIEKFYEDFGQKASPLNKTLSELMFYPTLVTRK